MDHNTPLPLSGESSFPSSSNETAANRQHGSVSEVQASSSAKATSSSLSKTLNRLPRELRDFIYEAIFEGDMVIFGRRGVLPKDRTGPSHPEMTSQVASKYRLIYPGLNSRFGAQDDAPSTDDHGDQDHPAGQTEMTAYGASVRKSLRLFDPPATTTSDDEAVVLEPSPIKNSAIGILLTSKQNCKEALPFLYGASTFLFEDFDLSVKFFNTTSFENLKRIRKIAVYYPQELEGTLVADRAIADSPDFSPYFQQSVTHVASTESRLRRALVSFQADPADDFALAYNIATQGTAWVPSVALNRLVSVPSGEFPARWLFGVMCRRIVASMPLAEELTVWVGDTLELEFNSHRSEIYEAALLQFAALGKADALIIKKHGEIFDNSNDEDARWHEVNWMKLRTLNGVEEMIRGGEHGALDRHSRVMPDSDE